MKHLVLRDSDISDNLVEALQRAMIYGTGFMKFDSSDLFDKCCSKYVPVYIGNKWFCETCAAPDVTRNAAISKDPFYRTPPMVKKCDCGASKTPNSNCHARWCSAAAK